MKFSDNLKELLKKRGTQARCSEGTGIAESLLSNYKNEQAVPTLPNAVAIADYFDVSLDWLAGREGFDRNAHRDDGSPLAPDELELLESYGRMDEGDRPAFMTTARGLAYAGEAKKDGKGADAHLVGDAVSDGG